MIQIERVHIHDGEKLNQLLLHECLLFQIRVPSLPALSIRHATQAYRDPTCSPMQAHREVMVAIRRNLMDYVSMGLGGCRLSLWRIATLWIGQGRT